jgi:hypothetical protein
VTDIVYLVRPGNENPELRYSLRSVHRNMPHERVWLFGHRPSFVSAAARHVFVPQRDPLRWKRQNALLILQEIAARADIDRFVLFNDDFFVTQLTGPEPPPLHRGSLVELARRRARINPSSHYTKVLDRTARLLTDAGMPDALSYETHSPMTMTRDQLSRTLAYIERHAAGKMVAPRSILGNVHHLGGELTGEIKVYGPEPSPSSGPFLSTTDSSFKYHAVGKVIRRAFPDPSPYEQGGPSR